MDTRTIYLAIRDLAINPWVLWGVGLVVGVIILVRVLDSLFRER